MKCPYCEKLGHPASGCRELAAAQELLSGITEDDFNTESIAQQHRRQLKASFARPRATMEKMHAIASDGWEGQ